MFSNMSRAWQRSVKAAVCLLLTVGSSFIERGSPSGHTTYFPSRPFLHSSISHITMSPLLRVISTCILLTERERVVDQTLFFLTYNPDKLRHQSAEPLQQAEAGSLIESSGRGEVRAERPAEQLHCLHIIRYCTGSFTLLTDVLMLEVRDMQSPEVLQPAECYLQSLTGPCKFTILLLVIASRAANAIKNPIHSGLSTQQDNGSHELTAGIILSTSKGSRR